MTRPPLTTPGSLSYPSSVFEAIVQRESYVPIIPQIPVHMVFMGINPSDRWHFYMFRPEYIGVGNK